MVWHPGGFERLSLLIFHLLLLFFRTTPASAERQQLLAKAETFLGTADWLDGGSCRGVGTAGCLREVIAARAVVLGQPLGNLDDVCGTVTSSTINATAGDLASRGTFGVLHTCESEGEVLPQNSGACSYSICSSFAWNSNGTLTYDVSVIHGVATGAARTVVVEVYIFYDDQIGAPVSGSSTSMQCAEPSPCPDPTACAGNSAEVQVVGLDSVGDGWADPYGNATEFWRLVGPTGSWYGNLMQGHSGSRSTVCLSDGDYLFSAPGSVSWPNDVQWRVCDTVGYAGQAMTLTVANGACTVPAGVVQVSPLALDAPGIGNDGMCNECSTYATQLAGSHIGVYSEPECNRAGDTDVANFQNSGGGSGCTVAAYFPGAPATCRFCVVNRELWAKDNPGARTPDWPDCPCCVAESLGEICTTVAVAGSFDGGIAGFFDNTNPLVLALGAAVALALCILIACCCSTSLEALKRKKNVRVVGYDNDEELGNSKAGWQAGGCRAGADAKRARSRNAVQDSARTIDTTSALSMSPSSRNASRPGSRRSEVAKEVEAYRVSDKKASGGSGAGRKPGVRSKSSKDWATVDKLPTVSDGPSAAGGGRFRRSVRSKDPWDVAFDPDFSLYAQSVSSAGKFETDSNNSGVESSSNPIYDPGRPNDRTGGRRKFSSRAPYAEAEDGLHDVVEEAEEGAEKREEDGELRGSRGGLPRSSRRPRGRDASTLENRNRGGGGGVSATAGVGEFSDAVFSGADFEIEQSKKDHRVRIVSRKIPQRLRPATRGITVPAREQRASSSKEMDTENRKPGRRRRVNNADGESSEATFSSAGENDNGFASKKQGISGGGRGGSRKKPSSRLEGCGAGGSSQTAETPRSTPRRQSAMPLGRSRSFGSDSSYKSRGRMLGDSSPFRDSRETLRAAITRSSPRYQVAPRSGSTGGGGGGEGGAPRSTGKTPLGRESGPPSRSSRLRGGGDPRDGGRAGGGDQPGPRTGFEAGFSRRRGERRRRDAASPDFASSDGGGSGGGGGGRRRDNDGRRRNDVDSRRPDRGGGGSRADPEGAGAGAQRPSAPGRRSPAADSANRKRCSPAYPPDSPSRMSVGSSAGSQRWGKESNPGSCVDSNDGSISVPTVVASSKVARPMARLSDHLAGNIDNRGKMRRGASVKSAGSVPLLDLRRPALNSTEWEAARRTSTASGGAAVGERSRTLSRMGHGATRAEAGERAAAGIHGGRRSSGSGRSDRRSTGNVHAGGLVARSFSNGGDRDSGRGSSNRGGSRDQEVARKSSRQDTWREGDEPVQDLVKGVPSFPGTKQGEEGASISSTAFAEALAKFSKVALQGGRDMSGGGGRGTGRRRRNADERSTASGVPPEQGGDNDGVASRSYAASSSALEKIDSADSTPQSTTSTTASAGTASKNKKTKAAVVKMASTISGIDTTKTPVWNSTATVSATSSSGAANTPTPPSTSPQHSAAKASTQPSVSPVPGGLVRARVRQLRQRGRNTRSGRSSSDGSGGSSSGSSSSSGSDSSTNSVERDVMDVTVGGGGDMAVARGRSEFRQSTRSRMRELAYQAARSRSRGSLQSVTSLYRVEEVSEDSLSSFSPRDRTATLNNESEAVARTRLSKASRLNTGDKGGVTAAEDDLPSPSQRLTRDALLRQQQEVEKHGGGALGRRAAPMVGLDSLNADGVGLNAELAARSPETSVSPSSAPRYRIAAIRISGNAAAVAAERLRRNSADGSDLNSRWSRRTPLGSPNLPAFVSRGLGSANAASSDGDGDSAAASEYLPNLSHERSVGSGQDHGRAITSMDTEDANAAAAAADEVASAVDVDNRRGRGPWREGDGAAGATVSSSSASASRLASQLDGKGPSKDPEMEERWRQAKIQAKIRRALVLALEKGEAEEKAGGSRGSGGGVTGDSGGSLSAHSFGVSRDASVDSLLRSGGEVYYRPVSGGTRVLSAGLGERGSWSGHVRRGNTGGSGKEYDEVGATVNSRGASRHSDDRTRSRSGHNPSVAVGHVLAGPRESYRKRLSGNASPSVDGLRSSSSRNKLEEKKHNAEEDETFRGAGGGGGGSGNTRRRSSSRYDAAQKGQRRRARQRDHSDSSDASGGGAENNSGYGEQAAAAAAAVVSGKEERTATSHSGGEGSGRRSNDSDSPPQSVGEPSGEIDSSAESIRRSLRRTAPDQANLKQQLEILECEQGGRAGRQGCSFRKSPSSSIEAPKRARGASYRRHGRRKHLAAVPRSSPHSTDGGSNRSGKDQSGSVSSGGSTSSRGAVEVWGKHGVARAFDEDRSRGSVDDPKIVR